MHNLFFLLTAGIFLSLAGMIGSVSWQIWVGPLRSPSKRYHRIFITSFGIGLFCVFSIMGLQMFGNPA